MKLLQVEGSNMQHILKKCVFEINRGQGHLVIMVKRAFQCPSKLGAEIPDFPELLTELDFNTDFDLITEFWRFP